MKIVRTIGLPTVLAITMGVSLAQDVAHDLDKGGKTTEHAVRKVGNKIGKETKRGAKGAENGTKLAAKDTAHGTEVAAKDTAKGAKTATIKTKNGVKDSVSK